MIKVLQYADDTQLFLDGTKDSLLEALRTLSLFKRASGLSINVEKSTLFPLGASRNTTPAFLKEIDLFLRMA